MSETINNSASTSYSFSGSSTIESATSNVLPVNFESSPMLAVSKTSNPSTFCAGEIITYTVTITNNSGMYLTGVRVIDNLGGGNLAYVLSSARLSASGQTYPVNPIANNPLTFTLQQLGANQTMTLTYKAQVIFNLPPTVSMITNSIKAIGYTSTGTVTGYANNTIEKKTASDFSITKSSNVTSVNPNESFNYYLTLKNNTGVPANINSITDNLPSNYTLNSVKLKIGSGAETTLSPSDYTLSASNMLTVPSMSGPTITVPAYGSVVVTLNGYFN